MKTLALLALIAASLCGCTAKTRENRTATAQAATYNNYVNQRTAELQRMGGPFKEQGAANLKAREEANSRFGGEPAEVTTTWSWGKGAGKVEAQEKFTGDLDDMAKKKAAQ